MRLCQVLKRWRFQIFRAPGMLKISKLMGTHLHRSPAAPWEMPKINLECSMGAAAGGYRIPGRVGFQDVWHAARSTRRPPNYFFLARSFARAAPATRLPAALEPYLFAALDSILLKFLPRLPMSLPARADFAE